MEEIEKLLNNRTIDFIKLRKYGFIENGDGYEYRANLIDNEFDIIVNFSKESKLDSKVIDLISDDEYILVKLPDAVGEYVGKVREAYLDKLREIIIKCSSIDVFKSNQAKQIIEYVKEKYDTEPEFLWDKFAGNAVFRHKENKKWYGALLIVSKRKLGIDSDEIVDIIDLKILPENNEKIVDNKIYFPGYHMNKKHWFTIILDNSVSTEEIFRFIDESYAIK